MQTWSDSPPRTLFALAPTPPYPDPGHTPCRAVEPPRAADPDLVPSSVWFGSFVPEHLERDFMAFLGAHNGVAVLTWPRDREHAEHLAQAGLPRLLLVPSPEVPPRAAPLQDWLPIEASHVEIHRCLLMLSRAAAVQRSTAGPPMLDDQGQLHVGDASVAIPVHQRALTEMLVTSFEAPVAVAALTRATNAASPTALFALLWQLERRANVLGLEIVPRAGDAHMLRRCAVADAPCTSPTQPESRDTRAPSRWPEPPHPAVPARELGRRRTLPMHFRSGLLAPNLP